MQATDGGPVEIGCSVDVDRRREQLEATYGKPLALLHSMPGGRDEERAIHRRFARHRLGRTERFRPATELMEFIGRPLLACANPDAVAAMPGPVAYPVRIELDEENKRLLNRVAEHPGAGRPERGREHDRQPEGRPVHASVVRGPEEDADRLEGPAAGRPLPRPRAASSSSPTTEGGVMSRVEETREPREHRQESDQAPVASVQPSGVPSEGPVGLADTPAQTVLRAACGRRAPRSAMRTGANSTDSGPIPRSSSARSPRIGSSPR